MEDSINDQTPIPIPSFPEFGHSMRQHYLLNEKYNNLNHGSYGCTPEYVIKARDNCIQQFESKPDFFLNYIHPKLYLENRKAIAKLIDVEPEDIVFVKNATEASACILHSLNYLPNDIILMFDFVYGAVKSLCNKLADKYQLQLVIMETNREILSSKEKIIQLVKDAISQYGKKIRVGIVDFITSTPALLLPIEEIISIFRENDIFCMIDGAHAFNHIEFSLKKLDPDFFYTNLHKWGLVPKSLAVLYVKKNLQHLIHHAIQLAGFKKGLTEEFIQPGSRDLSNIYSLKESMVFLEKIGRKRMMEYCQELAIKVGKRISEIWNTELLVPQENKLFMVNVVFPYQGKDISEKIKWKEYFEEGKTFLAITLYKGVYYARFSCYIYNQLSDYETIAFEILENLKNSK